MPYSALLLIGLVWLVPFPARAADASCRAHEDTIFSCALGTKRVAVCASHDLSPTRGYVQYRFGPKNAPAFIIPASTEPSSRAALQARTLMFAGGGGGYIRFLNGRYHYIVYTAIGKGWGTKDGVAVEKDGKLLTHFPCQDVPVSKLGKRSLPRLAWPLITWNLSCRKAASPCQGLPHETLARRSSPPVRACGAPSDALTRTSSSGCMNLQVRNTQAAGLATATRDP